MTRITRRIALLLSLPLTSVGCQSASVPPDKPSALMPRTLSAEDLDARTAAALQASDHATGEMVDALKAIEGARAIVQHNMSNADTTGYKATNARCQNGGRLSCQVDFTQGTLENTGRPMDVGVQGEGFFAVKILPTMGTGIGYTRSGNFVVNKNGELVLNIGDGYKLIPPLTIPVSTTDITVGVDGTVSALLPGQTAKTQVGTLHLVQFMNPQGLGLQDGVFFTETEASGPPTDFTPGSGGTGQLLQGFLEASNVDLDRESMRLHYLNQWRAELLPAARRD
jgi:flagellar basal body rod protein FlgG